MKKIILAFIFMGLLLPQTGNFALAQTSKPADSFELNVAIENPLGKKKEIKDILAAIMETIVDIALPVVIVMVIYSGFLYVLARGRPDAVSKAHQTLTWTLVGAVILLGAQLIATVLVETVSDISADSGITRKK